MPTERENFYQPLTAQDYNIAAYNFRAYYDADKKLVFVLDFSVSDVQPNVLLVINPDGNRKWDDILANDYGVDLETVRPKKDNKYQKLDVEYTGLREYDDLIQAYENDDNMSEQLRALADFKAQSVRRAAGERLAAAELTADKSRETIERTNNAIDELNNRLKTLRAKLKKQRQEIGKEPTKQSAAKILRTESQIDSINDKLERAQRRLTNAQRRLAAASDDAEIARNILNSEPEFMGAIAIPNPTDVVVTHDAPVPSTVDTDPKPIQAFEPKADDMADEEVKPLFDEDPDILNDEIAFKPIDFDAPATMPTTEPLQPISFTPPAGALPEPEPIAEPVAEIPMTAPVLDAITSVEVPNDELDSEFIEPAFSMPEQITEPATETPVSAPVAPAPVMPEITPIPSQSAAQQPQPMPEIAPAPNSVGVRPLSPITGASVPETPIQRKPTMMYYIMLIILIVLSIFTLWIYQKSANTSAPNLDAKTQPMPNAEIVQTEQPATEAKKTDSTESPFVQTVTVDEVITPKPAVATPAEPVIIPEPEPAIVTPEIVTVEPEPVPVESEKLSEPETVSAVVEIVPVTAEPVTQPVVQPVEMPVSPFISDEVVTKKIPTEAEVLASKPAYNVSQQEKMFVAETPEPEYTAETVAEPEYTMAEPEIISESVSAEEVEMCAGGTAPDTDGCCPGEYLTEMDDGTYACCADGTDECFPPMF